MPNAIDADDDGGEIFSVFLLLLLTLFSICFLYTHFQFQFNLVHIGFDCLAIFA